MNTPPSESTIPVPAWPPLWPEIRSAVNDVLNSGEWGRYESPTRDSLAQELATFFGVDRVRLVSSGSVAVELALRAVGVDRGDEVILAAYDYPGNFRAVELCGATPVLVDVAAGRVTMDASAAGRAIGPKTKAVLASHLFGTAAPVEALRCLCDDHAISLVEDVCQAPGMQIGARMAGSFGDLATLSFGGSKPLTAGNGGAVLVNRARPAARLGPLVDRPSDAFALSPMQAAALRPQIRRLRPWAAARAAVAGLLAERLRLAGTAVRPIDALDDLHRKILPSHYKFAFVADSESHRNVILARAADAGLPIRPGFRATDRSSERRCRKPQTLENAATLGRSLCVLSHTALMVPPPFHQLLGDTLAELTRPGDA